MAQILVIVLPVFGLIAVGLLAVKFRLITAETADGVGQYSFVLAMPAYLFRTLADSEFPASIPWGYWASYFGAIALSWIATQLGSRRLLGLAAGEAVLAGMSAAMGNTVMIGIPLLVKAYGDQIGVPVALILGLNLPVTMTVATFMVTKASGGSGAKGKLLPKLARGLATHPLFLAIVAGTLFNLAGFKLSGPPDQLLTALGVTGVPCALVSLGGSLARYGIMGRFGTGLFLSAMKLLVTPGLVFLFGAFLFHLPPVYLATAVVFAAAPVGVNVYLFALRYETSIEMTSAAIALSSLLAVVTTSTWLWFLGIGG